mgnify:CR=1 FL=1
MGGQQSVPKDGDNNNCGCGFLGNVVKVTQRKQSMDLIGSPEPETPAFTRRKRAEVAKAATMNNEVRSSRYGGLEKETIPEDTNERENNSDAIVHEGPVRIIYSTACVCVCLCLVLA